LAGAYADARRRLTDLLVGLDEAALMGPVPACPAWTVRDVLAHVTGVAADVGSGTYFTGAAGAADAWNDARPGRRARRVDRRPGAVQTRPAGGGADRRVDRLGGEAGADARRSAATR
jgi:hypothetical protein